MKASFAKELPSIQEPDHSLLALWRDDGNFDGTALDVKYRVGHVALTKDLLVLGKPEDDFPWSCLCEKGDQIKWRVFGL